MVTAALGSANTVCCTRTTRKFVPRVGMRHSTALVVVKTSTAQAKVPLLPADVGVFSDSGMPITSYRTTRVSVGGSVTSSGKNVMSLADRAGAAARTRALVEAMSSDVVSTKKLRTPSPVVATAASPSASSVTSNVVEFARHDAARLDSGVYCTVTTTREASVAGVRVAMDAVRFVVAGAPVCDSPLAVQSTVSPHDALCATRAASALPPQLSTVLGRSSWRRSIVVPTETEMAGWHCAQPV
mmetsp:Transcript_1505/g.4828  ORF Transcript_1505/g.4828 Transcript_1505/m.4828 type:complete len:242 (-) Transcript_1505:312-1037(-)